MGMFSIKRGVADSASDTADTMLRDAHCGDRRRGERKGGVQVIRECEGRLDAINQSPHVQDFLHVSKRSECCQFLPHRPGVIAYAATSIIWMK